MMGSAAGVVIILAILSVTSSADNNYYATCASNPAVGVLNMRSRPGKVKGHNAKPTSARQCRIGCTRELNPVCGSDGTTYGNECALCAAACRNHALYLACRGECPCEIAAGRGDPGTMDDTGDAGPAAVAPQNIQQYQQSAAQGQAPSQDSSAPRQERPHKLKKNPNPVIVITSIDLDMTSGKAIADTLNRVTLDLHADVAPESNPVTQSSLWVVELYYKAKGKSPKQGLVSQALDPNQSDAILDVGQPVDIRGIEYELDLRGKTCEDVHRVCAHLKHQKAGKRRAKVIGKPSSKVLRRCVKVKCKNAGQQ